MRWSDVQRKPLNYDVQHLAENWAIFGPKLSKIARVNQFICSYLQISIGNWVFCFRIQQSWHFPAVQRTSSPMTAAQRLEMLHESVNEKGRMGRRFSGETLATRKANFLREAVKSASSLMDRVITGRSTPIPRASSEVSFIEYHLLPNFCIRGGSWLRDLSPSPLPINRSKKKATYVPRNVRFGAICSRIWRVHFCSPSLELCWIICPRQRSKFQLQILCRMLCL